MWDAAEMMTRRGGGFVKALADAWRKADGINRAKLEGAFPKYFGEYKAMAARFLEDDIKKVE